MTDRPPVTVSVDKSHCQLYGICQAEHRDPDQAKGLDFGGGGDGVDQ